MVRVGSVSREELWASAGVQGALGGHKTEHAIYEELGAAAVNDTEPAQRGEVHLQRGDCE